MDAKEYVREKKRMCNYYTECYKNDLKECPARNMNCTGNDDPEMVDIVEKWSKEHPIKTNFDKLCEIFPDATFIFNKNTFRRCYGLNCSSCKQRRFWEQEYKEPKENKDT